MIKLATVSPCYNEEEVLRHSVERLTALFERMIAEGQISKDSMMVFVNDGSRDRTWQLIEELHRENQYVRGINLSRNVGHQNAIFAGMMTARNQADPFMKRMTAMAFYKLQNSMGVESVYNHADFRLMSKRALDMLADYKETNLYLRGLIPQIGLRSTTVDDVISERYAGASKYTLKKMLRLAFNGITAFSVKPMHAIFFLGVLFLIVAFFIGLYVIHALITRSAVPGWSSLILSVWLVGGFIILSIGIAGLYIGNIYNEVKHRPLYHIQEILD